VTAPQYAVINCADRRDHPMHAYAGRPSMHQCVDAEQRVICPGGRAGDRRLRESENIANLWTLVRLEMALAEMPPPPAFSREDSVDEPPEPDYDEEYEADRAADRYEAYLDSQW
jgi:hypothetical protein